MAVTFIAATSTLVNATASGSITLATATSTSGNILFAGVSVYDSTSTPPMDFTSTLAWGLVASGSSGANWPDNGVWAATSTGGTNTFESFYTAAATGGQSILVLTEFAGHGGTGVAYSTATATGNTQGMTGSIVTTSNNSGVVAFLYARAAGVDTRATASGFALATGRASSAGGSAVSCVVFYNTDVGLAGTYTFVWGNAGSGTNQPSRMMFLVEIKQSAVAGTFNYSLLEGIVERGVYRGVARGVA